VGILSAFCSGPRIRSARRFLNMTRDASRKSFSKITPGISRAHPTLSRKQAASHMPASWPTRSSSRSACTPPTRETCRAAPKWRTVARRRTDALLGPRHHRLRGGLHLVYVAQNNPYGLLLQQGCRVQEPTISAVTALVTSMGWSRGGCCTRHQRASWRASGCRALRGAAPTDWPFCTSNPREPMCLPSVPRGLVS
jgi:hypothetical protein